MSMVPDSSQTVALVIPGVGRIGARVEKTSEGFLSMRPLEQVSRQLAAFGGGAASVMFTTQQGVHRLNGQVRRNPLRKGTLRFDFDAPAQLVQRRAHVRIDVVRSVRLYLRSRGNDVVDTNTLDLSGGGMAVNDSYGMRVGDVVAISLDLDEGGIPMRAVGTVVRSIDARSKGIQFDEIAEPERQRLVHFLFGRQRHELQLIKGTG